MSTHWLNFYETDFRSSFTIRETFLSDFFREPTTLFPAPKKKSKKEQNAFPPSTGSAAEDLPSSFG